MIKSLSLIICLIQTVPACHASKSKRPPPQDNLYIRVETTVSEHSMDSNSETTTLTVSGDVLLYQQARSGAHSGESKPIKKRYPLSREDMKELDSILSEKNLIVTKSISKPLETTGPRSRISLSLSIQTRLNGKEGSISIDGPLSAPVIKNDPLYQQSLLVIEELYRIIKRTDPLLGFQGFTDER